MKKWLRMRRSRNIPFSCEERAIKSQVRGSLDEAHVGRNTVTHGQKDDVADYDFFSRYGLLLAITDDGRVFCDERLDRVHDA